MSHDIWVGVLKALLATFFAMSVHLPVLQRVTATRILVFFGALSYPLYLLHENMVIASVVKMGDWPLPGLLVPLVAIGVITALAWLVAHHGEKRLAQAVALSVAHGARHPPCPLMGV